MPFKVLLLKNETEEAMTLLSGCLKMFAKFLSITHLSLSRADQKKLDLLRFVKQDQQTQFTLEKDAVDSLYQEMRDNLVECIDKRIVEQETNRMKDKEFIDHVADNRVLKQLKYSLLMNESEPKFLNDFNKKIRDMMAATDKKLEEAEKELKLLKKTNAKQKIELNELRSQIDNF